jgi:hypothetical protein
MRHPVDPTRPYSVAGVARRSAYVALAFMRSEDGDTVACEPKEARSWHSARSISGLLSGKRFSESKHEYQRDLHRRDRYVCLSLLDTPDRPFRYLTNLPAGANLRMLAATIKARCGRSEMTGVPFE